MKCTVVMSSQLGSSTGLTCWLPARFLGGCVRCNRVASCNLPEAENGRVLQLRTLHSKRERLLRMKLEELNNKAVPQLDNHTEKFDEFGAEGRGFI